MSVYITVILSISLKLGELLERPMVKKDDNGIKGFFFFFFKGINFFKKSKGKDGDKILAAKWLNVN